MHAVVSVVPLSFIVDFPAPFRISLTLPFPYGVLLDSLLRKAFAFGYSEIRHLPRRALPSQAEATKLEKPAKRVPEDTRMVSSLTRNQVPRKGLRVRLPCPPLIEESP